MGSRIALCSLFALLLVAFLWSLGHMAAESAAETDSEPTYRTADASAIQRDLRKLQRQVPTPAQQQRQGTKP